MKRIRNIFYAIGLLVIGSTTFISCGDEEQYDFPGDPYNHVYMKNNGGTFQFTHTPISHSSTLDFKFPLFCNHRVESGITARIEVDNSLVAAYNAEHETEYAEVPVSALNITNATLSFGAGVFQTADSLHITANDNISELKNGGGYLIPLRITSVEGDDCKIVDNMSTTYIVINVVEDLDKIFDDATNNDIKGSLVSDQSGWIATTNGTVSEGGYYNYQPLTTLFDGDPSSFSYITNNNNEDLTLDIDMGKAYTFDAIRLAYNSFNYGAFTRGMTIQISNDRSSWDMTGTLTKSSADCIFYSPVTARYIRITKPSSGWRANLQIGVFNVYEIK